MSELDKLYKDLSLRIEKSIVFLADEFMGIRTGKATPDILSHVFLDYYGSRMTIPQVANISCPEPRLIIIQPWDKTLIPQIKKAILSSNLGLNPQVEANIIRIVVPPLTQERRQELNKLIKHKGEEIKISIRNIRREINEKVKELKKENKLSEDMFYKVLDKVQDMTNEYLSKVDELVKLKEKEILEY